MKFEIFATTQQKMAARAPFAFLKTMSTKDYEPEENGERERIRTF